MLAVAFHTVNFFKKFLRPLFHTFASLAVQKLAEKSAGLLRFM